MPQKTLSNIHPNTYNEIHFDYAIYTQHTRGRVLSVDIDNIHICACWMVWQGIQWNFLGKNWTFFIVMGERQKWCDSNKIIIASKCAHELWIDILCASAPSLLIELGTGQPETVVLVIGSQATFLICTTVKLITMQQLWLIAQSKLNYV